MSRRPNQFEKDELLRWFIHNMPMEQRRELMATYPRTYARIFPKVSVNAVISQVSGKIVEARDNERDPVPNSDPVL